MDARFSWSPQRYYDRIKICCCYEYRCKSSNMDSLVEFTDNGTQGCVLGHGTGNINLGIAQKQDGN